MNEKLTFQDLIDLLAKKAKISKKASESFLKELFAVVYDNIIENEIVKIKDFGTFKPTYINSRESVDVNTGRKIQIAAHYRLSFVPDKALKDLTNKPFASFESILLDDDVDPKDIVFDVPETIEESVDEDTDVPELAEVVNDIIKPEQSSSSSQAKKDVEEAFKNDSLSKKDTSSGYIGSFSSVNYSYVSTNDNNATIISIPVPSINPIEVEDVPELPNTNIDEVDEVPPMVPELLSDDDELPPPIPLINDETIQADTFEGTSKSNLDKSQPPKVALSTPESEERQIAPDFDSLSFDPIDKTETEKVSPIVPKVESSISDNDTLSLPSVSKEVIDKEEIVSDVDEAEDVIYADYDKYYEEETKSRKAGRFIPYIIISLIILVGVFIAFMSLYNNVTNDKRLPEYYARHLSAADTMPFGTHIPIASVNLDNLSVDETAKNLDRAIDSLSRSIDETPMLDEPEKLEKKTEEVLPAKTEEVKNTNLPADLDSVSTAQLPTQPEQAAKKKNGRELQVQLNKAREYYLTKKDDAIGEKNNKTAYKPYTVTLKKGETLRSLSEKYLGAKEYWIYLYQENKGKISDPDNVPVGTALVVPDITKYVKNPNDMKSVQAARQQESQILKKR